MCVVDDEAIPDERYDGGGQVPQRMRVHEPPHRTEVEYLEEHERVEEQHARRTPPHVAAPLHAIAVERPRQPAQRIHL